MEDVVNRPSLGQIALEGQKNLEHEAEHTVAERTELATDDRIAILEKAYQEGKKRYPGDFYIEMCCKHEKMFYNVQPRWIPHVRQSCPTPMFEQTVYRYNRQDDYLEYLWVIPDIRSCCFILENALILPNEQKELLNFVVDFTEGNLKKLCLKLNGEIEQTQLTIN